MFEFYKLSKTTIPNDEKFNNAMYSTKMYEKLGC
jgi:hypothetical protein